MNTTQLEYLLKLADTLSYTKAANELGIAQPTLTKAIQHLEAECGFPFFERNGRQIVRTAQCETFLPYVRKALLNLNRGLDAVCLQRENIRIGCVLTAAARLPEVLAIIRSISANSYVQVRNGVSKDLIQKLQAHELDLVLCTQPQESISFLHFEPLFEQKMFVCVYPGHRLAGKAEVPFADIAEENIIAHPSESVLHQFYVQMVERTGIHVNIVAEADEDRQIAAMVCQKLGISIISTNNPDQFEGVVMIPLKQKAIRRYIALGYRSDDAAILPFVTRIRTAFAAK